MSKSPMVKRLSRVVLAGAVLGALSFGASQLLGGSNRDCQYGPCVTKQDCIPICLYWFPDNGGVGLCRNGCCICAEGPQR